MVVGKLRFTKRKASKKGTKGEPRRKKSKIVISDNEDESRGGSINTESQEEIIESGGSQRNEPPFQQEMDVSRGETNRSETEGPGGGQHSVNVEDIPSPLRDIVIVEPGTSLPGTSQPSTSQPSTSEPNPVVSPFLLPYTLREVASESEAEEEEETTQENENLFRAARGFRKKPWKKKIGRAHV